MLENQFRHESREESKKGKKKLDVAKMVTNAKLHFKELRFDVDQVLVSIAIFIRKKHESEALYDRLLRVAA